ncbi:MAG: hypothetical protein UY31_C0009G0001, partial [Candidatus Wolfebacteria bacterium GW2011_GWE1_48_7]
DPVAITAIILSADKMVRLVIIYIVYHIFLRVRQLEIRGDGVPDFIIRDTISQVFGDHAWSMDHRTTFFCW